MEKFLKPYYYLFSLIKGVISTVSKAHFLLSIKRNGNVEN